ncbi:hypothetical protein [Corynebacterium variabile]|uniref:hypothetical protein n=1 Tax=Corynebacterium variabile TaxID=1727 RepID=UPI003FCF5B8D
MTAGAVVAEDLSSDPSFIVTTSAITRPTMTTTATAAPPISVAGRRNHGTVLVSSVNGFAG